MLCITRVELLSFVGLVRDNAPAQVPLEEMFEDLKIDETDETGDDDGSSAPHAAAAGGVYLDEGDMDL